MIIRDMFAEDINRKINGVIKVDQDTTDVIEQEVPQDEYVKKFVQFIRESKRGITLRKAENTMC